MRKIKNIVLMGFYKFLKIIKNTLNWEDL
jgi:hypothetical protein